MNKKLKHALLLLLSALIVSFIFIGWSEARRIERYELGMSLTQVRSLTGNKYGVHQFALSYEKPPSEQEMLRDKMYYVYDSDSGVILYFNHFQTLIEKTRTKYFGIDVHRLVDWFRR
jgi:hypothetical protein